MESAETSPPTSITTPEADSPRKTGELKDGTKIPDDAKATFQLVGKEEKPAGAEGKEPKKGAGEKKGDGEEANEAEKLLLRTEIARLDATIVQNINYLKKNIIDNPVGVGKEQKEKAQRIVNRLTAVLPDPPVGASLDVLRLSIDFKKVAVGEKGENDPELFTAVAKEINAGLEENDRLDIEKLKAFPPEKVQKALAAVLSGEDLEVLAKRNPEFTEIKGLFSKKFIEQFTSRLFDLETMPKEHKRLWGGLKGGASFAFFLYLFYEFFQQQVENLDAEMVGGGQTR